MVKAVLKYIEGKRRAANRSPIIPMHSRGRRSNLVSFETPRRYLNRERARIQKARKCLFPESPRSNKENAAIIEPEVKTRRRLFNTPPSNAVLATRLLPEVVVQPDISLDTTAAAAEAGNPAIKQEQPQQVEGPEVQGEEEPEVQQPQDAVGVEDNPEPVGFGNHYEPITPAPATLPVPAPVPVQFPLPVPPAIIQDYSGYDRNHFETALQRTMEVMYMVELLRIRQREEFLLSVRIWEQQLGLPPINHFGQAQPPPQPPAPPVNPPASNDFTMDSILGQQRHE